MGLLDSAGAAGAVVAFIVALTIVDGLKCLSCRGQTVYECIMSAMISVCGKGEECRFRKMYRNLSPKESWFEADCAPREACLAADNHHAHFCCRISYCNYLPVGK